MDNLFDNRVGIAVQTGSYGRPPFSPVRRYAELPWSAPSSGQADNAAYAGVRSALELCGLDAMHADSQRWNPFRDLIKPGQTVVIKPNFVRDFRETRAGDGDCLITSGAVIRAVVDYALLALEARGRIIIADAPQNDADFDAIRRIVGLDSICGHIRRHTGFEIEVYDLRPEGALKIDGVIVGHRKLPGDPAGYVPVNLGQHSAFCELDHSTRPLYGAEYDRSELKRHHRNGLHEYLISRSILEADVMISVPKLKTHKKVGLTANLKNTVGINGNKNWLPHYREGTPGQGGDQFADDRLRHVAENWAVTGFKRIFPGLGGMRATVARPIKAAGRYLFGDTCANIRSGNWHGNDTAWRMVLDINRILHYADAAGTLHPLPRRRFFSVVDAIIAGEGFGPLDATPRRAGFILAGRNPVAVDMAAARMMGLDWRKLPMLARAWHPHRWPLVRSCPEQVELRSSHGAYSGGLDDVAGPVRPFAMPPGWRGYAELDTGEHAPESELPCAV